MNEARTLTINHKGEVIDDNSPFIVVSLSWVAYLREVWMFFVRAFLYIVASMVLSSFFKLDGNLMAYMGLSLALAHTAYKVALLRSVRVFTDDTGVWMMSGVFPWEKGVSGVQWRDVGQAGFNQSFFSWASKSYEIVVSHRFTTGAELRLRHVKHGNLAVQNVNNIMARLQGAIMAHQR